MCTSTCLQIDSIIFLLKLLIIPSRLQGVGYFYRFVEANIGNNLFGKPLIPSINDVSSARYNALSDISRTLHVGQKPCTYFLPLPMIFNVSWKSYQSTKLLLRNVDSSMKDH